MPRFFSHDFPQFEMPDLKELIENPGLDLIGSTLGELLIDLENKTGIYVIPDDALKYFKYFQNRQSSEFMLVDIHVRRNGEEICPKQDLMFPLFLDDTVEAGMLIC